MLKELMLAFPDSAQFSRACAMLAADEKLTVADISANLAAEKEAARVAGIEAELTEIKTQLAAKDAEIVALRAAGEVAKKGADPINLGSGDAAPVDANAVVEKYLSLKGKEKQDFLAAHSAVINGLRQSHGRLGQIK